MYRKTAVCVLFSLCLAALMVALGGCPPSTGSGNEPTPTGCGNEPITIGTVTPVSGQNLRATEITLTGGCFDQTTTVILISDQSQEYQCTNIVREDAEHLKAKTPVGIPVGVYAIRAARGGQSFNLPHAFTATANIVVTGGPESLLYVVDVSDLDHPEELLEIQPWGQGVPQGTTDPTVNYNATRVYFGGDESDTQQALYGADLATGGARQKITSNVVPYYGSPDASPVGPKITFVGAEVVSNVPDVYVVNEDGSGQVMIADHEDLLVVNGDNTGSWGLSSPVFSPDGAQIACIRSTLCPGCTHDWYSVIMVMNADGSGKHVAYWEPEERFYANLRWTWDNLLVWQRRDSDVSPQQIVALDMDTAEFFTITPPDDTWGDFVWLVYSPVADGLILQPSYTATMAYYPITLGAGAGAAGSRSMVNVPNPAEPGAFYSHYNAMDWFGWKE
jgi:hypothetical protein